MISFVLYLFHFTKDICEEIMFRRTKIQFEEKNKSTVEIDPPKSTTINCSGILEFVSSPEATITMTKSTEQDQQQTTTRVGPRLRRMMRAFRFMSSVLGMIGGFFSLYQLYSSYTAEEKFEVRIYRKW